jgi:tol-pal system protein YbgF
MRSPSSSAAATTQAGNDVPVGPGPSPRPGRPQAEANPNTAERTGFGSVTVSPDGEGDQIGKMINAGPGQPGPQVASAPADGDVGSKQVYETAYGHLLQRDYGAAEAAFEEFLRRYPSDPLAGNAQYWLGESLYVRGQYRAAAGAFLKGYQTYSRSAKAPESLLKLAMSLQRLGQKDAACSSYSELTTKFPNAPPHVKTSAQAERQRAGC